MKKYFHQVVQGLFLICINSVARADDVCSTITCFGSQVNSGSSIGIIGGTDATTGGYAAIISPSGTVIPLPLSSISEILDAAINSSGQGLIGGADNSGNGYAAFTSPSGGLAPISLNPISPSEIRTVAINSSGQGLIGGVQNAISNGYAALITPSGVATELGAIGANTTEIDGVAINCSGLGIVGGQNDPNAYAAFVSPSGGVFPIAGLPANAIIRPVAINNSGQGIIGGAANFSVDAYAALVSLPGVVTASLAVPTGTMDLINSVAINDSGNSLIGGSIANHGNPYAAVVSPSGTVSPLNLPALGGEIFSVALNNSGKGIIGGTGPGGGIPYAAFVLPGTLTPAPIDLSFVPNGEINSVAINSSGQALIGGAEGSSFFAALVSSTGAVTQLPLPSSIVFGTAIFGVSFINFLSLPAGSLSGNNKVFAKFINNNAPQNVFFFIPSMVDGTLNEALESAAPTRNGFSVYTTSMNLFYLTTALSTHLNEQSSIHLKKTADSVPQGEGEKVCDLTQPDYTIWFEPIGALAYQKAQRQTPAFHPTSGGGILAFDAKPTQDSTVGGGAAYLYTHIHEKDDAGSSNINQEELFLHGAWDNRSWYVQGFLLGGLFQTRQVREIHMTCFSFNSRSKPHGWQLMPHVELGYNYRQPDCPDFFQWRLNPFAMVDWANNWQDDFQERGSGPFNVGQNSHYSSLLRTEAGIRFYETFLFDTWSLTLEEKTSFVNIESFRTGKVTAFFIGSPGLFTLETLSSPKNLGVGQFLMSFNPLQGVYPITTIFYQGEFGNKYQSHQVDIELSWGF